MTDRDTITLPRELAEKALEVLEHFKLVFGGYSEEVKALRTHLAAPSEDKTHPGYVIGSHWLETAYSRICAGEAEADVLRDCGWERVDEALRRENERLQDVVDSIYVYANDTLSGPMNGPDDRKFYREGIAEIRNRARQLSTIGSAVAARAAIDAAIKGDKR